jgi:LPS sulfotransferase NodH
MNKVFIVGAPRSGTTWLQLLLAQHPSIATCQETHFFSGYIKRWFRQWESEARSAEERRVGLSSILTRDDFLQLCRESTDFLFKKIASEKEEANWVVEKTPVHVRYTGIIQELYPDSRFVHMVRDPRSVVASLKAASGQWGRTWKNLSVVDFTNLWVDSASLGETLVSSNSNAMTIKYEQLRADPSGQLQSFYDWLGVSVDRPFCDASVAACDLGTLKNSGSNLHHQPWSVGNEPKNFFRSGEVGSWKRELSAREVLLIESLGGQLMERYGYSDYASSKFLREQAALPVAVRRMRKLSVRSGRMLDRLFGAS